MVMTIITCISVFILFIIICILYIAYRIGWARGRNAYLTHRKVIYDSDYIPNPELPQIDAQGRQSHKETKVL